MTAIDQHKKCIAVLEMIDRCDSIINEGEDYLSIPGFRSIHFMSEMYKIDTAKYTAIKQRLQTYHHNLVKKIA